MPYIFRQKFRVNELVSRPVAVKRVLIAEPESYIRSLFAYHLAAEDYHVKSCDGIETAGRHVALFKPHLLLINPSVAGNWYRAARALRQIKDSSPELLLVTVSFNSNPEDLKRLLGAGVNAHLDRKFTKPEDVVTIVRSLLNI